MTEMEKRKYSQSLKIEGERIAHSHVCSNQSGKNLNFKIKEKWFKLE